MGLAGLWGGSWPSTLAPIPARAAPAVNNALCSFIGAKCFPELLWARVGSQLSWGLSWRSVQSFLLPIIRGDPSRDGMGRGYFYHSQHPGCLGHQLSPATQWGRAPEKGRTRRLFGAGKTLISAGIAREGPAWLAHPSMAISMPTPGCHIPGADVV